MLASGSIFSLVLCLLLSLSAPVSAAPPPSQTDRALTRAAVDTAELSPQRTRSLRLRLHLASLLPQLRVTFGRGWQLSSSRDYLLETPTTENDRLNYAITASWDLARLLVPHEELHLIKEEQRRAALRLRLEERLTRLLAERCRLSRKPQQPTDQAKLDAVEATLQVLTGSKPLPSLDDVAACPASPLRFGVPAAHEPASADYVLGNPPRSEDRPDDATESMLAPSSPDE